MSYMHINETKCTGCGECAENCPFEAIKLIKTVDGTGRKASIGSECCLCSTCEMVCQQEAVTLVTATGTGTMQLAEDFHF